MVRLFKCTTSTTVKFAAVIAAWIAAGLPTLAIAFDCIELKCGEISSCAEAAYKLEVCGHNKRDADRDGIPCETLCGHDYGVYRQRVMSMWPNGLPPLDLSAATVAGTRASTPAANGIAAVGLQPPDWSTSRAATIDTVEKCEGKTTCRQMVSCDEARFYLTTCGVRSLDGNGDGIPCNALCRQR